MAWIDYKKADHMVPHLWIIECLDLFGVAENIKSLLANSMEKWKVIYVQEILSLVKFKLNEVFFKEIIYCLWCLFEH